MAVTMGAIMAATVDAIMAATVDAQRKKKAGQLLTVTSEIDKSVSFSFSYLLNIYDTN